MFKETSPRVETADQSETSPESAESLSVNQVNSGEPAKSPLPNPNVSSDERSGETRQYQYLPVRNIVVSNHGSSSQPEFQTKQNLGPDPSSTLPVLSFDEVISSSTSEMDLAPDGIPRPTHTAIPYYTRFSTSDPSQVSSAPFPGVAPHFESDDYEKLGIHAASYTNRSQSYMTQTSGPEELDYIAEETWDFDDTNIPDDLYDTIMNIGPAGQDTIKRSR
jgi:hypothetical protein